MPAQARPCEAPRACKRRQSKVKTCYACCASSYQHVCFISVVLCVADVQTRLLNAQWGIDARETYSYPMAVLCTLPAQKFSPVCKPHFIKSRFSLLVVFQILCFTKLRFLQLQKRFLQKFKIFGLWRLRPQSRTADVCCYGSRQNSQRYTLRFSGVQIFF